MKHVKCIAIGGSAGSFGVVSDILENLPSNFALPVVICMHRLKTVNEGFVEALQLKSNIQIKEPYDKEKIRGGVAYLAPANYHMYVEINKTIALSTERLHNFSRPSIDLTLQSAAFTYRKNLVGIILSGANEDGGFGLKKIKDKGGVTIIQSRKEAIVPTMPKAAKKLTTIDEELTTAQIIEYLTKLNNENIPLTKSKIDEDE